MTETFRTCYPHVITAVIEASADPDEEVPLHAITFMCKLLEITPMMLIAEIDKIVDSFNKLVLKMTNDLKKGTPTER